MAGRLAWKSYWRPIARKTPTAPGTDITIRPEKTLKMAQHDDDAAVSDGNVPAALDRCEPPEREMCDTPPTTDSLEVAEEDLEGVDSDNSEQPASDAAVSEPILVAPAVSSAEIRQQAVQLEAAIPALHDALSKGALAAYAEPANAELRRDADQALASLRDASDRLQQLHAAAELAERQEADYKDQLDQLQRRQARDKLIRKRDQLAAQRDKEARWRENEQTKLDQAETEQEATRRALEKLDIVIEVQEQRLASSARRSAECEAEIATLDAMLADFPLSAAEEGALRERQAREAEERARAEEQARLAAEAEAYQDEIVSVRARWEHHRRTGKIVPSETMHEMPRRKVAKFEKLQDEMGERHAAEIAEIAAERAALLDREPWQIAQTPGYFLGLKPLIRKWCASGVDRDAIKGALQKANEHGNTAAADLLREHLQDAATGSSLSPIQRWRMQAGR
jgi:hypothetical protein